MTEPPSRAQTLARLHLHAVLPALADLAALVPEARQIAARWHFSLRLQLPGGPAATLLSPGDGTLRVEPGRDAPARLVLTFLSAHQLNRTFLNQSALPPLPTGGFWRVLNVRPFIALTKLLDRYLQPTPEALTDEAFRRDSPAAAVPRAGWRGAHGRGERSRRAPHAYPYPGGSGGAARAIARARGLDALGARTPDQRASVPRPAGSAPDAIITFTDLPTADDALLGRLDPNAAVGLGRVDVRGLIPLADGLSVVMDRVEGYIKPPGSPVIPGHGVQRRGGIERGRPGFHPRNPHRGQTSARLRRIVLFPCPVPSPVRWPCSSVPPA